MNGHSSWKDINHKADPRKVADHKRAMERELTLAELRKLRELTQQQLARSLDTSQSSVSQIEKRTDLYVSTLRSYIEAVGGRLEIVAVFPDGAVTLRDFAELEEPVPA